MGFDTQAAIIAQNAATAAAGIVAATAGKLEDTDEIIARFEVIRTAIFEGSIRLAQETETGAPERGATRGGGFPRRQSAPRSSGPRPSDQSPGDLDFRDGKHAGKTIAQVHNEDPQYLSWAAENLRNDFMRKRIGAFLDEVSA